ncbi:unnamed protein product [Durusdinium trenchii]|uniref:Uncharacterized protein n=1 Tax=Durusdinium trenchii TaxID=1381693 RepID=A0ABP0QZ79_9DINO
MPGVSQPCASCDDVLFTNPLELAAGLLDALTQSLQAEANISDGSEANRERIQHRQTSCAISARIQSAICVGAAMSTVHDPLPEVIYKKLQQALAESRNLKLSNPLQHLQLATLLQAKFLLELCFGCGRASSVSVNRLAVRLFAAMQISDGSTIWSILEELRGCMKRNWQQHKTLEGHRFQVACVVLIIYGLISLLGSRVPETLENSEYSVSAALDEVTTTAQALTMTESHQVSSMRVERSDDNNELGWLVSWMVLHAAGTLFCPKPCNSGQKAIQAWAIKHALDLSTGQPQTETAVALRAVSLLIVWRDKLEGVGEEVLVDVVKALSAASAYSANSPADDYGDLVMMLLEMPFAILGLGRVRCVLHIEPHNVVCVPGMSADHESPILCNDIFKSDYGLSPDQLPLEFLGRDEWREEGGAQSPMIAPWKLEALISRPKAMFTVHDGILQGEDVLMATMTLADAKVRCTSLPNCVGFYSDEPANSDGPVDWHFKAAWNFTPLAGAISYQKERASPLFTRHQGYTLDGADLLVSEMSVEAAKKVCIDLQDCMGFDLKGDPIHDIAVIHFKPGMQLVPDAGSMCYVFQTETRSHALPADGAAFFQLVTEGEQKGCEDVGVSPKSDQRSSKSDQKSSKSDQQAQKLF